MTAAGVIPPNEFIVPQRVSKERLEKLKDMENDPEAIMRAISPLIRDEPLVVPQIVNHAL